MTAERQAEVAGNASGFSRPASAIEESGMRTVEHLFESTGLSLKDVTERSGLPVERVQSIAEGRWTPSPEERGQIAAAFGADVGEISWGHSMNRRDIRYRGHGLRELL